MKLDGRTAIVAGAGRDIGRACAIKLAVDGSNVALNYFASSDSAQSAVAEITAAGGKAFALQDDLNPQDGVDALVNRTVAEFGGVDVLVNNTGGLIARKTIAECHWCPGTVNVAVNRLGVPQCPVRQTIRLAVPVILRHPLRASQGVHRDRHVSDKNIR